jgi:hypothetical protein
MRTLFLSLLCSAAIAGAAAAQDANDNTGSAYCSFQDGKQISARFTRVSSSKESPPNGRVWAPGGSALILFTETETTLGGATIPVGGFTMYLLPGKKEWTLIVSRNTDPSAQYDPKQDLARAAMQIGTMSQAEPELNVTFGHSGPKACEINVDWGTTKAWVDFLQK